MAENRTKFGMKLLAGEKITKFFDDTWTDVGNSVEFLGIRKPKIVKGTGKGGDSIGGVLIGGDFETIFVFDLISSGDIGQKFCNVMIGVLFWHIRLYIVVRKGKF